MAAWNFLKLVVRIAAVYLCVVLLMTIAMFPLPELGKQFLALVLDVLLVPLDLVWFPTHSTPIWEGCVVVIADSAIWGAVLASVITIRRNRAARMPTT